MKQCDVLPTGSEIVLECEECGWVWLNRESYEEDLMSGICFNDEDFADSYGMCPWCMSDTVQEVVLDVFSPTGVTGPKTEE
jgi:hypothetical protein